MKKKTSKVIHTLKTASVQGASVDDGQHADYCLEVTISLGNLSSKMLALLSTVPETSSVEGASVDDSQHACVLSQRHHQSKEPRQTTATTHVCRPGGTNSLRSLGSKQLARLSTVPETSSVQGASVKKKKKNVRVPSLKHHQSGSLGSKRLARMCTVNKTPSVQGTSVDDGQHAFLPSRRHHQTMEPRQQTASTLVYRPGDTISLGSLVRRRLARMSIVLETPSVYGSSVDDGRYGFLPSWRHDTTGLGNLDRLGQNACLPSQRHDQSRKPRQITASTHAVRET